MACPLSIVDAGSLSAESFYEDFVAASEPLIIQDSVLGRLKARWSDEYLAEHGGHLLHDEVRLASNATDIDFPLTKVAGERSRSLHVREFLQSYRRRDREINMYATNLVVPKLRTEYPRPAFTSLLDHGCASGWCGGLWIGAGMQRSSLHRDFSENLHAVVEGSKTFTLFAPNETTLLFPRCAPRLPRASECALPVTRWPILAAPGIGRSACVASHDERPFVVQQAGGVESAGPHDADAAGCTHMRYPHSWTALWECGRRQLARSEGARGRQRGDMPRAVCAL